MAGFVLAITILVSSAQFRQPYSVHPYQQSQYIQESREDLQEALVNTPERLPHGLEIRTQAGLQVTIGDVKQDLAVNRQIYNDLHQLQASFNAVMQKVLNIGINPADRDITIIGLDKTIQFLRALGVRYNEVENFNIIIDQLKEMMQQIKDAPLSADFMLFKARLEQFLFQIEQVLYSKLVS